MWIAKKMSDDSDKRRVMNGSIAYSDSEKTSVSTVENISTAERIVPYGIAYIPPAGEKAVIIPVDDTQYCCGVLCTQASGLSPGEIKLFSSGGASVILRNNGTVVINGQVFEAEEKE